MVNKILKSNNMYYLMLSALAVTAFSLVPESALASSANVKIFARTICNVIAVLQGDVVRAIAAFGVIFLGFSLFLGKITWGVALAIGVGLGAVLGAEQIVNAMGNNSSGKDLTCKTLRAKT